MNGSVRPPLLDEIEAWLCQRPDIRYARSQTRGVGDSIRVEPQDEQGFSVQLVQERFPAWTVYAGEYGAHIHAADQEEAEAWLHLLLSDACQLEIILGAFSVRSIIKERQGQDWKAVEHFGALVPRFWKGRERLLLRNHLVRFDKEDGSDEGR